MAVVSLVGVMPAAHVADHLGRKWTIVPSSLGLAAALLLMATTGDAWPRPWKAALGSFEQILLKLAQRQSVLGILNSAILNILFWELVIVLFLSSLCGEPNYRHKLGGSASWLLVKVQASKDELC